MFSVEIRGRKNKRDSDLDSEENLYAKKDAFTNSISFGFTTLSIAIATKCDAEHIRDDTIQGTMSKADADDDDKGQAGLTT